MHAVVVRSTIHDFDTARKFLTETAIPWISQSPGFVSGQWVRFDDTDTGSSMVVFESEEAAKTAAEQLKANPPPGSAVTIDSIEVGELIERA